MSDKNSHTFTSAFRQFLVKEKLDLKYREKLLSEAWEVIVGKPIASRTKRLFIVNRVLHVELTSAPLKNEMLNHKDKVRALLEKDFGDMIDDLRFI